MYQFFSNTVVQIAETECCVISTDFPRYRVFQPEFCALKCQSVAKVIVEQASRRQSYGVTALAVHGLMESFTNDALGRKINRIQMIVPDGQPVIWALNLLHRLDLAFKIPGPVLTSEVLKQANPEGLRVFLYGSTADTLQKFQSHIARTYPNLELAGVHEDRFREATAEEDASDIARINASGAHIVLVGRGCPRQEHWVADHVGKIDAAMLAVGAAFDYHAGNLDRAPMWVQRAGLEWAFRLIQEPRRLWRRYLFTNTRFIIELIKHRMAGRKQ